ncbi:hypothetical protein FACS189472_08710 [Alphaproteobacteria bacterium]|nr:hypothetical protein FACS189472_08710 [Alphaproteobacteria bacterium]
MVGIYAKIKNGLNWLKGKAAKYIAPVVGGLGDFANSDLVQGVAGLVTPALNMAIPGLGTGINTGLSWTGKAGDIANGLADDYKQYGDDFGFTDMFKNVSSGKYTKKKIGMKNPKSVSYESPQGGVDLAKRPDDLHPRIKLKALPPAEETEDLVQSYVEEVD